ncbi:MAG: SufS family cysteine desulfurase [Anaeroplasmataceae bacterium]|nr:SufS family cysteine desulfurase [Anaeroplasmataceae bacterium]MDE6414755.1 SufS family cysteine desulfurase [Anaeroplasmataceae bacterium]
MNVAKLRKDFPVLEENPKLAYLDNAASTLKPNCVIEAVDKYYRELGVNVHRGVYKLSYLATDAYEEARGKVADFINASFDEIVFTRGASSALNLVAASYGANTLKPGDEVITTELEHHSSCMPWINVCEKTGAILKYVPLNEEGRITVEAFKSVLTDKTKVVAITYVSNVMGYVTPIDEIITLAHERGAVVVLDAAQAVPHMPVDVKKLDCDFLAFSGHKLCGPTGIGVLYGKERILSKMPPIEFGGDMADDVNPHSMTYKDAPYRFETGTPIIASAIGLGKAIEYVSSIGLEEIAKYEFFLKQKALEGLKKIPNIEIYNESAETGIISFNIKGVHPHDAASVFDNNDVCIRAGHHCAQLIIKWLNTVGTVRASFYFYNTLEDVEKFVQSVKEAQEFFGTL